MTRRTAKLIGAAGGLLVLLATPSPVYADDCSSLTDCYSQLIAWLLVILAIVALILLIAFLPQILAFLVLSGLEALGFLFIGADMIVLGEEVAEAEHREGPGAAL